MLTDSVLSTSIAPRLVGHGFVVAPVHSVSRTLIHELELWEAELVPDEITVLTVKMARLQSQTLCRESFSQVLVIFDPLVAIN